MFSKRRKNYRVFVVTALIISICILVMVVLWPRTPVSNTEDIDVNAQTNTTNNQQTNENRDNKPKVAIEDKEVSTPTNNQTYYIVKKYGEVISVFFMTEEGKEVKLEDTEILYDLLPPEDQKNFDKGIILEGQEELASLLQDFEG